MGSNILLDDKRRLRLARIALSSFFFINGLFLATWSARIPTIQARLALSPGQLGLALLGGPIGALILMNIAGRVSRSVGSRGILTTAALCLCGSLPLLAYAPDLLLLFLGLTFSGAANGAMEVTMSLQGTTLEQIYQRPLLNSCHAYFSIGGLVGALLGSMLAAYNITPELHFLIIALATSLVILSNARFLLPPATPGKPCPQQVSKGTVAFHLSSALLLLGLLAFCTLFSEGAMFDWSALYLSNVIHAGAGVAASGFALFSFAMTFGRSVGDYLTIRLGAPRLICVANLTSAAGLTLALAITWTPIVLIGLTLIGIGLSVLSPLALSAAGRIAREDRESTLVAINICGYSGAFFGPPTIGFLADRFGLRLALALVVLLCLITTYCSQAARE